MWKKHKKVLIGFSLGILVALLVSGAFWFGFFNTWQTKLTDKLFLKSAARDDIVIVAIDDESLTALGQWPWSRATHARAILNLSASQPKITGYDVIFSEVSSRGIQDDESLAGALSKLSVVLPIEADSLRLKKEAVPQAKNLTESIEPIKKAAKFSGHVNVVADEDGIVRRLPLFIESNEKLSSSLSLKISELAAGLKSQEIKNKTGNWLRINFIGPPGSFKTISFKDVYANNFSTDEFKGKIVLVGVTSSALHDQQMTPFSLGQEMSGVEIHANAV